jgi:DNA-directed RNA polymerase subunit RPC12/RpoP
MFIFSFHIFLKGGPQPCFKSKVLIGGATNNIWWKWVNMITINICSECGAQFLIPREYTDLLDETYFVCPECSSKHWEKLSDSPLLRDKMSNDSLLMDRMPKDSLLMHD